MPEQQDWERQTLERLAFESLKEQRRSRRWGIFFKSAFLACAVVGLGVGMGWGGKGDGKSGGKHTALVEINGVISADSPASADKIISGLDNAFDDKNTKGVVIRVNSPGGSPVQAGQINDEIRREKALHPDIPVYAVVDDICASGGYFVAVAADKIFVNRASMIGSIGVRMDGFGFTGIMQKLGVERRELTAGENKAFLDPFLPVNPKQKQYALDMLHDVHQQFIQVVRQGRGKRLKETPDMFSGLVWTGEQGVALGLADGYGSLNSVARDVIHAADVVDYTPQDGIAQRLAQKFGADVVSAVINPMAESKVRLH